ncbi:MAG: VCBS repeat-containing protein [Pseudomonadales bacterium]|nr:VCBS repeat-containing protein [Pseudomonadales bacterium]
MRAALLVFVCLGITLWRQAGAATEEAGDQYTRIPFTLPAGLGQVLVADADGDGLKDLLALDDKSLRIYFQNETGFDFAAGGHSLDLPGSAIGWDLAHLDQADSALTLLALIDGRQVLAWPLTREREPAAPLILLDDLQGFISKGVHRLRLAQDINADGRVDLVLPAAGTLQLHIRNADGGFQAALTVQADFRMRTRLSSNSLQRDSGQVVNIPLMQLRDVNADGHLDLISRTDEKLEVFIADSRGTRYFAAVPSYSLDLAAIAEGLGEFDVDKLDFSNLTGILALTHEEILEDIDGDGIEDLLLREGGKVSLFAGTATGMALQQPRQVLRSSGNVLGTFVHDEDGDGRKDLWLWRVEEVSVGDVFLWLALSGSVAVEAFIYPNEGDVFARRPSRKITVNLKFPSMLRLASSVNEMTRELREAADEPALPVRPARMGNAPGSRDLLALLGDRIDGFRNAVSVQPEGEQFLSILDYSRQRNDYEVDVRQVLEKAVAESSYTALLKNRSADYSIALASPTSGGDIIAAAINDDEQDDLFVFFERTDDYIRGMLLLSNSP